MKVLNVGSLNIDYTYHLKRIVAPGETITSKQLEVFAGGKGLNQSIALAQAGAEVYHAGKIGSDGQFLVELCQASGVDTRYIEVGAAPTGNAIIQVTPQGENSIILYPGANRSLNKAWIDQVLDKFAQGDVLLLQNEVNLVDYLISQAQKRGLLIYLNPSPFDEYIKNCDLTKVDTFLMNEVEGFQITGYREPKQILAQMQKLYPKAKVVLTLGKNGSYYQDDEQCIYQEAKTVTAVDTTGAGDTFTGYYIAAILEGKNVSDALLLASNAAALAVKKFGAAKAIPKRQDVDNEILRDSKKG